MIGTANTEKREQIIIKNVKTSLESKIVNPLTNGASATYLPHLDFLSII